MPDEPLMNDSQQLCESMWDFVYGLLSDEESAQLIDRIKSDPQAARLYAEVRLQADLVAAAAKVDEPALTLQAPQAPPLVEKAKPPHSAARPHKTGARRLYTALAAIGATALAALLACGLFWKIPSARQPRFAVEILGSAAIPAGISQQVTIRTVAINSANAVGGKSVGPLELRLLAADGSQLLSRSIAPEANGDAIIDLPGDLLQPGVLLEVASHASPTRTSGNTQTDSDKAIPAAQTLFRAALPVEPEPQLAYVLCAEPTVRPGQAVDVSLWNFAAFSNKPSPPAEAAQAAESVAGLSIEPAPPASAKQGLVNARLQVSKDEAESAVKLQSDAYLLQRSAGQAFSPAEGERLRREVLAESAKAAAPPTNQLRRLADNRRAQLPRNALRQMSQAKQQVAEKVATKELAKSVELAEAQAGAQADALPALSGPPEGPSDIPTIAAGQPIIVPLDPTLANRSLIATAVCRGVTVSTVAHEPQPAPVPATSQRAQLPPTDSTLRLDLPPEADGLIEVFVYDRASGEPILAQQREFYREPLRKLTIQLAGDKPRFVPGERVQLQVQVTDEKGEPAPDALVGVRVWNELTLAQTDQQPILLEDAVRNSLVEDQTPLPASAPSSQVARDGQSQDRKLAILQRSGLPQSSQRAGRYFVQPPAASEQQPQSAKREERGAAPAAPAIAQGKANAALEDQSAAVPPTPSDEATASQAPYFDTETFAIGQPILLATNRPEVTAAATAARAATAKAHQQWLSALGYAAIIGGILVLAALAISAAQRSVPNIAIAAPTLLSAAASIVIGIGWIGQQSDAQRARTVAMTSVQESHSSAPASTIPPTAMPNSATKRNADARVTAPAAATVEQSLSRSAEPPTPAYGAIAGGGLAGAAPPNSPPAANPASNGASAGRPAITLAPTAPAESLAVADAARAVPAGRISERTNKPAVATGPGALAAPGQQAPDALYFNPQLATDAKGHAEIEFVAPQVKSEYRVLVDALGRGRVGSYQQQLIFGGPEGAK